MVRPIAVLVLTLLACQSRDDYPNDVLLNITSNSYFYSEDRSDIAAKLYDITEEDHARDAAFANCKIAEMYMVRCNYEKALDFFEAAYKRMPSPYLENAIVHCKFHTGKISPPSFNAKSSNESVLAHYAQHYLRKNSIIEYSIYREKIRKINPGSVQLMLLEASRLYFTNNPTQAIPYIKQALLIDPMPINSIINPYSFISRLYCISGSYSESIKYAEIGYKLYPHEASAVFRYLQTLLLYGDRVNYDYIASILPDRLRKNVKIAQSSLYYKSIFSCNDFINCSIEDEASDPFCRSLQGMQLQMQGRLDDAIKMYDDAIKYSYACVANNINMALALALRSNPDRKGIALFFDKAQMTAGCKHHIILFARTVACFRYGDADSANKYLEQIDVTRLPPYERTLYLKLISKSDRVQVVKDYIYRYSD